MIGDLPWGSHFCQFYQTAEDLWEILVPYLRTGLQNNEYGLWVTQGSPAVEEVYQALHEGVPHFDEYARKGQMEIISRDQWKTGDGELSSAVVAGLDKAISRGFDGLRLVCNAFPHDIGGRDARDTADAIFRYHVIAAFAYPRDEFDAVGLMAVVKNHRLALVRNAGRWEVIESSEAHSAKDALRRSEATLQSVFANMSEGFAYHRIVLDPGGNPCDYIFLEVNEAFERLTGLQRENLLGRRATRVLPGIENDPADWIARYGRIALTGVPAQFESYSQALQRWYSISAFSPHQGFFAVTFSDITERKATEQAIQEANERLRNQAEELQAQAEELQAQGHELQAQKEELTAANEELREHEQALRESEERFKLAAQSVSDVIWQWQIPTGQLSWHGRIDALLGYGPGEFPRTIEAWEGVIHPDDRDRVLAALEAHLKQGRPYREEYRVRRKDGTISHWRDCGLVQRNGIGTPYQMIGSISDITGRKRADEALRESEHRVRAKLEAILTPAGDIGTLDLADMIDAAAIQALMEDFYKLAGMPMSIIDLQGRVLVGVGWQTICTKFHRLHPQTCRHCLESDTQLSAGLAPGEIKLYQCPNHMWDIATPIFIGGRHAGNVFSGQFLFEGEPIDYERFRAQARRYGFDEVQYLAALEAVPRVTRATVDTGMAFFTKLAHMLSQLSYSNIQLARSLSAHDRLTNSLRENEERLKRAQTIAHLGSWELDLDRNELTWSDEVYRIFGLEPQEFGATYGAFLEHVHPEDRAAVDAAYASSLQERRDTYEIEHRVVRRSTGQIRSVHEKCEHFRDAAGNIVRSTGMVHDITERKQAEEALIRAATRFEILSDTASKLLESKSPRQVVNSLCRRVMEHLDCHVFVNYLVEEERQRLHLNACGGLPDPTAKDIEWLDFGQAICGRVVQEGKRIVAENIQESCDACADLVRSFGIRAYACHPIIAQNRVIGTLSFGTRSRRTYSEEDLALMKTVTDQVGTALERIRAQESLQKAHDELESRVAERTAELQRTTELLRAERKRLEDVLEMMPAYAILLTPDYHVAYANRTFREWFGDDYGQRCYEFLFHRQEPCEICETCTVLKTGRPHVWEWTGPNGRNYDIYDYPFTDAGGAPLIMEIGLDVTAHKQAQRALQLASRYSRSLIEASLDPLVTISPEGRITDVNEATIEVTGVPRLELVGSDFCDYFTEPDQAREGYQKVISDGYVRDYPLTIRHASGRTTDVLYNATVYCNEGGQVQGVFAAARDITERKRVEAELARHREHLEELVLQRTQDLARSNRDLEQFAYVASHDLQEPLRAVAGFVSLLQQRYQGKLDEKADGYIGLAIDGATRMQTLIGDLLGYSRVGTKGKAMEPTQVRSSVNDALTNLQASIVESGAVIQVDALPTVQADAVQLTQLYQNLIANALKFRSDRSPEIHIGARRERQAWLFWVRDNGIGIEPQYAERIFLIFQRLHTRTQYPGTGIGLAVCKRIVERHGGTIWVESQPGQGSTFYFTLPDRGEHV